MDQQRYTDEAMELLRNSLNEALEANMKRVFDNLVRASHVLDTQADFCNAVLTLLVQKGVVTNEEFKAMFILMAKERTALLQAAPPIEEPPTPVFDPGLHPGEATVFGG